MCSPKMKGKIMKKQFLALALLALAAQASVFATGTVVYADNGYNGCCPPPARRVRSWRPRLRRWRNNNCCPRVRRCRPKRRCRPTRRVCPPRKRCYATCNGNGSTYAVAANGIEAAPAPAPEAVEEVVEAVDVEVASA